MTFVIVNSISLTVLRERNDQICAQDQQQYGDTNDAGDIFPTSYSPASVCIWEG